MDWPARWVREQLDYEARDVAVVQRRTDPSQRSPGTQ